jgi:hypothetical protein
MLKALGLMTVLAALSALWSIVFCMSVRVLTDCGRSLRAMNKKLPQR